MGRPLKIKQSTTIDIGFNSFANLDPDTQVIPAGMTSSEYLGVVGGANASIATATNPVVAILANITGAVGNAYIITQKGQTKYLVADEDTAVTAGSFVVGTSYVILSLGDTNWALVGAGVNPQVGDVFTATSVGSGTGTVNNVGVAYLSNTATPAAGYMSIEFTVDGSTALYASKLTNKYIWDSATPANKYAVNFFDSANTTAASGAQVSTWTNTTGLYTLAQVDGYTS